MPKFLEVTDKAAAKAAINADYMVNAKDFGATGDGVTDDTAALQDWVEYVVVNNGQGFLPAGTYRLTDTLTIPAGEGWAIYGENRSHTVIEQDTDNIPVIQLGDTSKSSQGWTLENLTIRYVDQQPVANTNAFNLYFQGPATGDISVSYFARIARITFARGYYAMKTAPGKANIWGTEFDLLFADSMSGGFYDNSGSYSVGAPNNKWGNVTISCDDAAGPIFKEWSATAMTVGSIEFLHANNAPQLIQTASPFQAEIGTIRVEECDYSPSAAGNLYLFSMPQAQVKIGYVDIGGNTAVFTPNGGVIGVFNVATGSTCFLEIGTIKLYASSLTGTCVAVTGGRVNGLIKIKTAPMFTGGWTLQWTAGSSTGNYVTVDDWVNHSLSGDEGDANYTVALGDPNVVQFKTAFTGQRTITLPSQTSNDLCAGLYYDLVFDGAINGSNTALIKQGSTTLRTQTVDKVRLRYMWRRGSNGEWQLVDVASITGSDYANSAKVDVFTSSGTWTKPSGAVAVQVRCIAPGGGGGAGARGPSGTALSGGGGGGSGGMSEMTFRAADLASTVSVSVGTGGPGASGQTSNDSAGAGGTAGVGSTSFGSHLQAGRGAAGSGGGLGVAGSGGAGSGSGWSLAMHVGVGGGSGSATGAAGGSGSSGASAGSGAAGGGITTAPAANVGGTGGTTWAASVTGGTAGSGANGGAGGASGVRGPGAGGGGGGANTSGAGYNGGNGGIYGAGGGGGGASLNGSTSGAGGNGADGIVIVTTYF